ncbi:MAG: NADP-dependent phosphogluconate dehydrogenase [Deltaproteobacteria bacterium]|nr:NADP-dependent phosphogluconate dehydrogenase [Deltaproteobacteria bacterium]
MSNADIGMIGLAVMGANLIRNIERNKYSCVVYNRTSAVTEKFMQEQQGKNFIAADSLQSLVSALKRPRKILVMVKAGDPVDAVIESLIPLLDQGDIICDLGNSHYLDTIRREKYCKDKGLLFIGVGVSGGEEGALNGPSIMPGGDKSAWSELSEVFDAISAKVPEPCHVYIGPNGAGHFVKTVHNGIEYGDMQLIAESYDLLRKVKNLKPDQLHSVFQDWNQGVLSSFLVEITAEIFLQKDDQAEGYLVDHILDKAKQKGTGKWTAESALELGIPIPVIAAAVTARGLSMLKNERKIASTILSSEKVQETLIPDGDFISAVHDALYCSKIVSYAQGLALLSAASAEYDWDLKLDQIAAIWRGGCIIRAKFLAEIMRAYKDNPKLSNLLLDPVIQTEIENRLPAWRRVVAQASLFGIPILGFSSALSYYDSYRTANLPQNLTQAQRDFFGAHTFERTDKEGSFHAEWGQINTSTK